MQRPTDASGDAQRSADNLSDLGRMPDAVRALAYSDAATTPEGIALYQVASTDGLTRDPAELRRRIKAIPDVEDRRRLLAGLEGSTARSA